MGSNYDPFAAPQHNKVLTPSWPHCNNSCLICRKPPCRRVAGTLAGLCLTAVRVGFQRLAAESRAVTGTCWANVRSSARDGNSREMTFQHFAGAAYRALTSAKDGPSLYELCDPLLLRPGKGDPHLAKFYQTALGNPALRPLLWRAGLSELREPSRFEALRGALRSARDDASPDWAAIGQPVAELLDTIRLQHPRPKPMPAPRQAPDLADLEKIIRICGAHLLRSFGANGFIPTYAAFNLIGDPDVRGRELLMALTGLNSRGYKNSTLLFNLARIFIARSPAGELINPPWRGIAEPMWQPIQIRHRSAYYDAFFTEALLSFIETGLASSQQTASSRRAISDMVRLLPHHQPRRRARAGWRHGQRHHRAGAAAAPALQPLLCTDQAGPRLRHLRARLRHHRLRVLRSHAGRLRRSDPRPAAARLLCRLSGRRRRQRAARDGAAQ